MKDYDQSSLKRMTIITETKLTITTVDEGTKIVQKMRTTVITITTETETGIILPDVEITIISGIMEAERTVTIVMRLVPCMDQNVNIR